MDHVNVVVEAKSQYTKKLISILLPSYLQTFYDLWKQALLAKENDKGVNIFIFFQKSLAKIPFWDTQQRTSFLRPILDHHSESFLKKLIEAIFVLNTKVLSIVGSRRKLQIILPDTQKFIYKILIASAKNFYEQPKLFESRSEKITSSDVTKNSLKIKSLIKESIVDTIESYLPINSLLEDAVSDTNVKPPAQPLSASQSNSKTISLDSQFSKNPTSSSSPDSSSHSTFSSDSLSDSASSHESDTNTNTNTNTQKHSTHPNTNTKSSDSLKNIKLKSFITKPSQSVHKRVSKKHELVEPFFSD